MTFKEFVEWCNDRACDGCWGAGTAITCINIINGIRSLPFWRRRQKWAEIEEDVINQIVNPLNERRKTYKKH